MKVTLIVNKGTQTFHYSNVEATLIQQQKGNGNWLFIYFKKGTEDYELYANQDGSLPIQIDLRHDQIMTY